MGRVEPPPRTTSRLAPDPFLIPTLAQQKNEQGWFAHILGRPSLRRRRFSGCNSRRQSARATAIRVARKVPTCGPYLDRSVSAHRGRGFAASKRDRTFAEAGPRVEARPPERGQPRVGANQPARFISTNPEEVMSRKAFPTCAGLSVLRSHHRASAGEECRVPRLGEPLGTPGRREEQFDRRAGSHDFRGRIPGSPAPMLPGRHRNPRARTAGPNNRPRAWTPGLAA